LYEIKNVPKTFILIVFIDHFEFQNKLIKLKIIKKDSVNSKLYEKNYINYYYNN